MRWTGNLAVVRALLAGPRPKRSILLVWDSGEEVGLWGTRTIAYGPWSEKLVLHVSNDMIGKSRPANSPRTGELSAPDTELFDLGLSSPVGCSVRSRSTSR